MQDFRDKCQLYFYIMNPLYSCNGNKLFYDLKADEDLHTHEQTLVALLPSLCGSHVFDFFHLALRVQ